MLSSNVRHAVRRLAANPGATVVSAGTLALAIATCTTIVSVIDTVLVRPLPLRAPARLAMLWTGDPGRGANVERTAYGTFEAWRRQAQAFDDMAAYDPVSATVVLPDRADQMMVIRATPNFFGVVGVSPRLGRTFTRAEADARAPLALVSERFWKSRFGSGPGVIGATLGIDGQPFRVIGVVPDALRLSGFGADVWQPQTLFPDWADQASQVGTGSWFVIGRLAEGVELERASAELGALAGRLDEQLPLSGRNRGVSLVPLARHVVDGRTRTLLWTLAAAAGALLLVAAINVAGISLARAIDRMPELALRAALGATRRRIVGQLLVESATLASLSGGVGALLAVLGVRLARSAGPAGLPALVNVAVDGRTLGWAVAASTVAALLVGLAPLVVLRSPELTQVDAGSGRRTAGRTATRLRRLLVAGQCAIAIMLLSCAGLLVRSWLQVLRVDPGFQPDRVLSLSLAAAPGANDDQRRAFYASVLDEVSALPGVGRAGIGSELLVSTVPEVTVRIEGSGRAGVRLPVRRDEATAGYFEALGTPVDRASRDGIAGTQAARSVVINQTMARRLWGDANPVGSRISLDPPGPDAVWYTVSGVAGDMRRQGLEAAPVAQMFEPLEQNPPRRALLLVRATSDGPLALVASIRDAVRRVDPRTPVYGVTTVDSALGGLVAQRRLQTTLLAGFAAAALLLAGLGVYGLVRYAVATRTREIGVRMALGARPADIFRMVVGEGLRLALAGAAVGLVGALWATGAMSSLLFGVTATDPVTFAVVSIATTLVVITACCLPARRAMRVAPVEALHHRDA